MTIATRILIENSDLVAIAKNPGELVVADRWGKEPRENIILYSLGDHLRAQGHKPDETGRDLYPVHRLDRETSGIVLFAKNQDAHRRLSIFFENRQVKKTYFALVVDCPDWDYADIRVPLKRAEGKEGRGRSLVSLKSENEARTEFFTRERYGDLALIEAHPHTGKLHQIRVHMRLLGHPLFRDPDYGYSKWKSEIHEQIPFAGMWLHAAKLVIPASGPEQKAIEINCPVPEKARKNLDLLFEAGEEL